MKASLGGKNLNFIFSCYWGKWISGWHSYFSKPSRARLWPSWDLNSELSVSNLFYFYIWNLMLLLIGRGAWELQMECLPRLFLELCLLEEISIPHSIFRDNHDWISYSVFQLMQISSRYNCLSLVFLSFSFLFFLFWWIKSCWIINFQPQNSLLILRAGFLVEKTPRHEWQTSRN